MGLFDKKYCDICGEKISLLGNRKLEDGNMCSSCAKLISPLMTDRRRTTVVEMKEHLAYREANKQNLAEFSAMETFDCSKNIYIDRNKNCFVVSYHSPGNWDKENPDVIPLSDICSCNLEIKEHREEEFIKDQQGNRKSYSPPRYKYDYDFYIHIGLSNRWFNEIKLKLNTFDVEGLHSQKYHQYEILGNQIIGALTGNMANYTSGTVFGMGNTFAGGNAKSVGAGLFNSFANQVAQNARKQQNAQQQQNMQYQQAQQQQNMQYQQAQQQQNMQYQQAQQQQNMQYQQAQQQNMQYQQAQQQSNFAQPTNDWFCPNCGTKNHGKFCENCGTPKP